MNFNRFQAAGNPRTPGNFPQLPPDASEPSGWGPTNNFGNNRRGLRNQNLNNAPTYLGQGGGFTNNWNNQPAFQRGMGSSAIRCHHSHLETYPPQTGYSYDPALFPGPMPVYPNYQDMASNFCQYPPCNAPEYLPYPGEPIVMIRAPGGHWVRPMSSMVDIYGPSTTATMDLGLELLPPDNLTQQGQQGPEIDHGQSHPANQVQSTEHQQDELQNPENINQSSPENLSQSAILEASNDMERQTDTADQTREDGDIDATIQPTEDPALTPKAGPSSDMRKAGCQTTQPSPAGSDKQLQETDIAELDGADQQVKKTSRRKRRRTPKRKTKCCRLCLNNGEAPEVYETHDVVDGMGVTTCPYLREQVCVLCKKTGDKAHTLKYCPTNIENRRWCWRQRKRAIENAK